MSNPSTKKPAKTSRRESACRPRILARSSGPAVSGAVTAPPALSPGRRGKRILDVAPSHQLDPQTRINIIREGIPASTISNLCARMGISKEYLLSSLGLSRAAIGSKEKHDGVLSKNESERVLGVEALIDMVWNMVEQSGVPSGFDAARWVAHWLARPLPALGGVTPASYLDTFEGQKVVAELLSMTQSGACA